MPAAYQVLLCCSFPGGVPPPSSDWDGGEGVLPSSPSWVVHPHPDLVGVPPPHHWDLTGRIQELYCEEWGTLKKDWVTPGRTGVPPSGTMNWPGYPLWTDLQTHVKTLPSLVLHARAAMKTINLLHWLLGGILGLYLAGRILYSDWSVDLNSFKKGCLVRIFF